MRPAEPGGGGGYVTLAKGIAKGINKPGKNLEKESNLIRGERARRSGIATNELYNGDTCNLVSLAILWIFNVVDMQFRGHTTRPLSER